MNPGYLRRLRDQFMVRAADKNVWESERLAVLNAVIELCDQVQQVEERMVIGAEPPPESAAAVIGQAALKTEAFLQASLAVWRHIAAETPHVEGQGYVQAGPGCTDPVEHGRLIVAEGEAYYAYQAIYAGLGPP